MIRVVLDTNVIVSAYLNQDGLPFLILKLVLTGRVRLYASAPILAEYEELLFRKSYPLDTRRARMLLKKLRTLSVIVNPQPGPPLIADPDDSIFLECAEAAKADYLVTGNTGHFPKERWKYTQTVTPRQFIDRWGGIVNPHH